MNVFQAASTVDCSELATQEGMKGHMIAKGRGSWCCIFHDDATPSLVTYPAEGGRKSHFYCFGCGRNGDSVDLYARLRNMAPRDAAKALCEARGLTYDEPKYPSGVRVAERVFVKERDDPRLAIVLGICGEWRNYRIKWYEEEAAHSEYRLREGCDGPAWRRDIEERWLQFFKAQVVKYQKMTEMEVLLDIREEFEALGVNPYRRLRFAGSVS